MMIEQDDDVIEIDIGSFITYKNEHNGTIHRSMRCGARPVDGAVVLDHLTVRRIREYELDSTERLCGNCFPDHAAELTAEYYDIQEGQQ